MRMRWLCCLLWRFGSQIHWSKCLQGSTVFVSGAVVFLAPGVSRRSWVPHIPMFARHFTQGCDNAEFANLDYALLAYWHLQRLCLHQVTQFGEALRIFQNSGIWQSPGEKNLGNPHFETYLLISGITITLAFQCPETTETAYRWVAFVPEARDFGCGYGHSKSTSFRLSAGGAGFGGFGGEIFASPDAGVVSKNDPFGTMIQIISWIMFKLYT